MGTKQEKEYWVINDFQPLCDQKNPELGILSDEFTNMLMELEDSYKERYDQPINLRKGFQKNGRYVFDGRRSEKETRKKLYEVLRIWKNESYKYYRLFDLRAHLKDLMCFQRIDGESIIGLLDEALSCFIGGKVRCYVGYKDALIEDMISELKELPKKCKIDDKEKSYKIAILFVRRFYQFVDEYSDKVNRIKYLNEEEEDTGAPIGGIGMPSSGPWGY